MEIEIISQKKCQAINITNKINEKLTELAIGNGFVNLFCPHTTASLIINEPESGLINDIERLFATLIPDSRFEHDRIDNNAKAHLTASLLNASLIVPVSGNQLMLGIWQAIIFCELDGPRKRKIIIREFPRQ